MDHILTYLRLIYPVGASLREMADLFNRDEAHVDADLDELVAQGLVGYIWNGVGSKSRKLYFHR
jgi:hypothetical protein